MAVTSLLSRCQQVLTKFVEDERLSGRCPLPRYINQLKQLTYCTVLGQYFKQHVTFSRKISVLRYYLYNINVSRDKLKVKVFLRVSLSIQWGVDCLAVLSLEYEPSVFFITEDKELLLAVIIKSSVNHTVYPAS